MSNLQVFEFEGRALTAYTFRGRECWIAQDVARVLGYEAPGWASSWREWTGDDGELIAPSDYQTLRGADLREFKRGLDATASSAGAKTSQLTIIYETGVNLVCTLSRKPLGKKLRRFIADMVLPQLRRASLDAERLRNKYIDLCLRLEAVDQPTIWEKSTVLTLCKLYRKPWNGEGPMPFWLQEPFGRIYKIVLGDDVYEALKARNPEPRDGSLHYQFLTEAQHKMTGKDMSRVTTVLNWSTSRRQFFERLSAEFGRTPRQLETGLN